MAITTDTGAKKIAGTDNWRDIFDDHNDTVDAYDANIASITDGMAIMANGNTHAAIAAGQAVYVRNHSTLADGLYWANTAIATNGTLSTSNLTADASGGLNKLKGDIDSLNSNVTDLSNTVRDKVSFNLTLQSDTSSTTDISTIALAAWNKAPGNGTAFIMQDCQGPVQQCLVFRRASSGIVLVLDATGLFYAVFIMSSAVSLVRKVSLTTP